jgi:hypothetical protein
MKTKNSGELSELQKSFIKKALNDPVLFANHILGVSLWEREVEILQSIRSQRRTAVKACHSVGKTFTLAIATLWWLARYPEGIVLTTSPTQRQVRTQLWSEIHRLVERAKVAYPKLKTTELKFRDDNNFAIGFSTNQAENFQGYHGKYVLIIADEAPGIDSGIWDAVAGTMAGGKVHIVMAGNPTTPSGAFFDAFTSERRLWNCITIGAFDSPNLNGLELEQLLSLDPAEGGPLDQNPYPHLVTRRWVYDQHLAWWHGSEGSSPNWLSRVLAQFPDQAQNALFRMAWLEKARQRALLAVIVLKLYSETSGDSLLVQCADQKTSVAYGVWTGAMPTNDLKVSVILRFDQEKPKHTRLRTIRVAGIGFRIRFLSRGGWPVRGLSASSIRMRSETQRSISSRSKVLTNSFRKSREHADGMSQGTE